MPYFKGKWCSEIQFIKLKYKGQRCLNKKLEKVKEQVEEKKKKKKKPFKKKCLNCGKIFHLERNNPKWKFHSPKCYWAYHYKIHKNKCPSCSGLKRKTAKLCQSCSCKIRRDKKTGRFKSK